MRLSCNGCRVLRKGCSEDCSIRPCLEWIKSPESQAHATVFLAKFYGRAGLMNLINAGPHHLRPAIFKSLLYEACGRIANPIFGSVGLIWSGSWQLCQDAVEAVLKGDPITRTATEFAETENGPPLKAGDIRHIYKETNVYGSNDLSRVRTRCRFKRSATKSKRSRVWVDSVEDCAIEDELNRSPSHESSLSQQSETGEPVGERTSPLGETRGSAEPSEPISSSDGEIELDLTLGFEPVKGGAKLKETKPVKAGESAGEFWKMDLVLDCSAS